MSKRWPVVLLCALLAGPIAQAQWVWRDQAGHLNASDRPPPADIADKDIVRRPVATAPKHAGAASPATAASAASAPRGVDPELEARRKRAEQEKAAQTKTDDERLAAQRAENCQRARQQLALLDSGQRVARLNDRGERIILDDNARAGEAAAAQRAIESDCR